MTTTSASLIWFASITNSEGEPVTDLESAFDLAADANVVVDCAFDAIAGCYNVILAPELSAALLLMAEGSTIRLACGDAGYVSIDI